MSKKIQIDDRRKAPIYAVVVTNYWKSLSGGILTKNIRYSFIDCLGYVGNEEDGALLNGKEHIKSAKRIYTYHKDDADYDKEVTIDTDIEFEFRYTETVIHHRNGEEIEAYHYVNYKLVKVKVNTIEE